MEISEPIKAKAAGLSERTTAHNQTANSENEYSKNQGELREGTKTYNVLRALMTGRSYNRFESARELHDWCLHSTVSTLQSKGLYIHRITERVPCLRGEKMTTVCRYSLPQNELPKARRLLGLPEVEAAA